MKRCSNTVTQVINELFQSEMSGEFRPGDTLGVWTYNEQLHTEFPMQVWKGTNGARILRNVMTYLGEEHFEHKAHLDRVMPSVGQVMAQSERLTAIFVYDGSQEIEGTPFDKEINGLQKQYASEFRSKHMPFVTAISARDGKIFDYTVSTPGTIRVPHTAVAYVPPPTTVAPLRSDGSRLHLRPRTNTLKSF